MTKQEAEKFVNEYKIHGCRDCVDASRIGQAMAVLMTDEQKQEVRKIIASSFSKESSFVN